MAVYINVLLVLLFDWWSVMTDLEICKRIAEIEGDKVTMSAFSNYENPPKGSTNSIIWTMQMLVASIRNPLTNDALCFKLMVKYKMDFIPYYPDEYRAQIKNTYVVNKSPNKAICLAIIEANK